MNTEQPNHNEVIQLNNRQITMLLELNERTGSDHLPTVEGYNDAGRSEGILDKLVANGDDREELVKKFRTVPRCLD